MNNTKIISGVIVLIILGTTAIITTPGLFESANALKPCGSGNTRHSTGSDLKHLLRSQVTMFTLHGGLTRPEMMK